MPERLSSAAGVVCRDAGLNPVVSVVSLLELIVKARQGHLALVPDPVHWWNTNLKLHGFSVLPVRQNHIERLWTLPMLHKDPSDRLLIAQAMAEGIPLVTPDVAIRQYSVEAIW
jgi:PIN domain nuclease of toxin-antitoxin system